MYIYLYYFLISDKLAVYIRFIVYTTLFRGLEDVLCAELAPTALLCELLQLHQDLGEVHVPRQLGGRRLLQHRLQPSDEKSSLL